jgi:radical SAM enzyme (TIGR01210 family)
MDTTEARSEEARERQQLINRITRRAWLDKDFRQLLVDDPSAAVLAEFGETPALLQGFTLRPASVDRVVLRERGDRQTLRIRPKSGDRPISLVLRRFLGEKELIAVLYTRRCAFACTFCTLPSAGAIIDVFSAELAAQLDAMTEFVRKEQAGQIARVALGNEGSFLDERTLPSGQLGSAMAAARSIPGAREIILETRPEFVTPTTLGTVDSLKGECSVALKIGLESSDDRLRNGILGKRMSLADFEAAVRYASSFGYALESYVLLKAHPEHTDAQARNEAIETCEYIKRVCAEHEVRLTLRVNSMYMAAGSPWAIRARAAGWTPPSVFDVAEVMWAVGTDQVRVFAGVSEEGLATRDGHFVAREDFQKWALDALEEYNSSGDRNLLAKVAQFRAGSSGGRE